MVAYKKWSHLKDMERQNLTCKGFRSKTFPPDRLFRLVWTPVFIITAQSLVGEG
jgi:hypothetical protein